MIRAEPIHRASAPDRRPATMPPMLPAATIRPVYAGRTCSTRTRKMISSVNTMLPKKLAVPVHAAILRSTGCRTTKFRPAKISVRSFGRSPPSPAGRSMAGSRVRISSRDSVDTP